MFMSSLLIGIGVTVQWYNQGTYLFQLWGIAHGNLKPKNILLKSGTNVWLSQNLYEYNIILW